MEEYFRNGLKTIGLWALVALAVLVVILVRSMRPDTGEDALNVFDHAYCVDQTLSGTPEEIRMVRLEEDKTMLLRTGSGVWQNLGLLRRGGTESGAVEVWNTDAGTYRILVMRDGVCLAGQNWSVSLDRVDTLSVGVNTESASQFITPQWYPEGEQVSQAQLSSCAVSGKATVVLTLEEYQDELTVLVDGEETLLPRDRSRAFLLDVEAEAGAVREFEIPYGAGTYRFVLRFE